MHSRGSLGPYDRRPSRQSPARHAPSTGSVALREAADKPAAAKPIGPDNFEISPSHTSEWKNKYYTDRGFKVASKDHVVRWAVRSGMPARQR